MLVLVSLERERADIIDRFKKAIKSLAAASMGADFVVEITARTVDQRRGLRGLDDSTQASFEARAMLAHGHVRDDARRPTIFRLSRNSALLRLTKS